MARLGDIARYIRSKNAGPFWITVDVFFVDRADFETYAHVLSECAVADCLGLSPDLLRRYEVPNILVVKLSYPRALPQGGTHERDMHAGQDFVGLLDLEL